jgi:hypothetical protein
MKEYLGFYWRYATDDEIQKGNIENQLDIATLKAMIMTYVASTQQNNKNSSSSSSSSSMAKSNTTALKATVGNLKSLVLLGPTGKPLRWWKSIQSAVDNLNINSKSIIDCCERRLSQAYGFNWRYAKTYEQEPFNDEINIDTLKNAIQRHQTGIIKERAILQIHIHHNRNNILYYWVNTTEITNVLINIDINNVIECCERKRKAYNGFRWRYATSHEQGK